MPPPSSAYPDSTRAPCTATAAAQASSISRLLPATGSPVTSATDGLPRTAAATTCSAVANSPARPTKADRAGSGPAEESCTIADRLRDTMAVYGLGAQGNPAVESLRIWYNAQHD